MALQIWLPLTNDLHNQGLNGSATVTGGSKLTSGGKLGAGHYKVYNGAALSIAHTIADTTEFSYAFWLNIPSSITSVEAWQSFLYIPGKHNNTAGGMDVSWTDYNLMKWYNSTGYDQKLWLSFSYDIWYHVAVVHSSGTLKIYINGDLGTRSYSMSESIKLTAGTIIIGSGLNATNGKIGLLDFRLYNHALSVQEVKELSKGLVAHYTLGSASLTSSGNLINGLSGGGLCTVSGNSINVSGTNSDTYFFIKTTKAMTSGKLYRLSCIGSGFPNNAVYYFPVAAQSNTGPGLIKIKNGPCMLTFVANDTCANAGTNIIMDDTNGNTVRGAGTISGLCLEEISSVSDSSGYSRNLTITGNVSCDSNTPRYDEAILFPANETSRLSTSLSIDPNAWTISFWEKCDWTNVETTYPRIVRWGDYIRIGKYETNGRMRAYYYYKNSEGTQTNIYPYFMNAKGTDTSWKHFALTFDGSTLKTYLNGTLNASSNLPDGFSLYDIDGNFILNYTAETIPKSLSDVRVYATSLSADDVKDLYNLGALIS